MHNLKNKNTVLFCKANYPSMYILHATLHFLHKTWTTIISVGQEDIKRQQHGKNAVQKGIAFLSKYKY